MKSRTLDKPASKFRQAEIYDHYISNIVFYNDAVHFILLFKYLIRKKKRHVGKAAQT